LLCMNATLHCHVLREATASTEGTVNNYVTTATLTCPPTVLTDANFLTEEWQTDDRNAQYNAVKHNGTTRTLTREELISSKADKHSQLTMPTVKNITATHTYTTTIANNY